MTSGKGHDCRFVCAEQERPPRLDEHQQSAPQCGVKTPPLSADRLNFERLT